MLKLEPLKTKTSDEFASDPYLKDIVERNLEVAAQACIDIANRIISMEQLEKPRDAHGAIEMLGTVDILPRELAKRLAPIAGLRNILVHEYLEIDWDEVLRNLQRMGDLYAFMEHIKRWLKDRTCSG
ncbi:DUF86 domain-containing protein [Candidatus Bipolaricaulota bacterium]|nr:DUF86 domain-containing protein [Candidatus Bipolaricaulota bacterium]